MPIRAGSHDENALQQIMKYIPDTNFDVSQIADDCDCTSCVVVSESALSIHETGPIYNQLLAKGDLRLSGNTELRRLPRLLAVTGNLDLSECLQLTLMPEALYVGGWADLAGTPIEALPAKMIVEGKLDVHDCEELQEIHEDAVCESLEAGGCGKLHRIPGKRVYGSLGLSGTAIEELPEDLKIIASLTLKDCKYLTTIPEGTTVNHAVDVRGCSVLFRLPKSLQPRELTTDTFSVSPTGLHTPRINASDAEMMIGRPARDVIHHHLLENLEIMKANILAIRQSACRPSGSFVTLDTPATRRELQLRTTRLTKSRL